MRELRLFGQRELTTKQLEILQTATFTGKEKKSLAYVIAIMNMILHGIDAPNIIHTKTNAESDKSWLVYVVDVDEESFDLSVKNPNAPEAEPLREPKEIIEEITALDRESAEILFGIGGVVVKKGWQLVSLEKLGKVTSSKRIFKREYVDTEFRSIELRRLKS